MKKAIVWLLVLTLCLTLCACGKKQDGDTTENGATTGATENNGSTDATENNGSTDATEATQGTEATTPKETQKTEETPKPTEAPQPTTPAHTHSWSAATCTTPKTCATCGATEGGKGSHTFTADCTVCGQPNGDFVPVGQSSWSFVIKGDGELTQGSYDFFESVADQGFNVSYTKLTSLEKFAQKYNMTIDQVRAEYAGGEMLKTVDGVEYIYDGWGMDNYSDRRYKEENGVITAEFLSLDWDDNDKEVWTVSKTVVLKRTGMAELTITSSNYEDTPVGLKLKGEFFGS